MELMERMNIFFFFQCMVQSLKVIKTCTPPPFLMGTKWKFCLLGNNEGSFVLGVVWQISELLFSNFSCKFLNPNYFFPIWIIIALMYWVWETSRNKFKNILFQKLYWPFTDRINYYSNLKNFANSCPSALNFKSFSRSKFFLIVGQNSFGNKIAFLFFCFRSVAAGTPNKKVKISASDKNPVMLLNELRPGLKYDVEECGESKIMFNENLASTFNNFT